MYCQLRALREGAISSLFTARLPVATGSACVINKPGAWNACERILLRAIRGHQCGYFTNHRGEPRPLPGIGFHAIWLSTIVQYILAEALLAEAPSFTPIL